MLSTIGFSEGKLLQGVDLPRSRYEFGFPLSIESNRSEHRHYNWNTCRILTNPTILLAIDGAWKNSVSGIWYLRRKMCIRKLPGSELHCLLQLQRFFPQIFSAPDKIRNSTNHVEKRTSTTLLLAAREAQRMPNLNFFLFKKHVARTNEASRCLLFHTVITATVFVINPKSETCKWLKVFNQIYGHLSTTTPDGAHRQCLGC